MSNALLHVIVVAIVVLVWLGLIGLLLRGWRNRGRRQADTIGEMPIAPDDLGATLLGPHTGLYVGSTLAPSWQNRVAVGDIGDRAAASLTAHPGGILMRRSGATEIWIPRASITAVRTERGLAGKVMTAGGLLAIRWVLPSGTEIDSGLRADDKTVYPAWIAEFGSGTDTPGAPASGTAQGAALDEQPDAEQGRDR